MKRVKKKIPRYYRTLTSDNNYKSVIDVNVIFFNVIALQKKIRKRRKKKLIVLQPSYLTILSCNKNEPKH